MAEVFQDFPRTSDFDPAFIADGKRTWFFFSVGRWNRYPGVRDAKSKVGADSFKVYQRYSDDSGHTWSRAEVIYENAGAGCRSNGIKLSTGELILPIHGYLNPVAGVIKSTDGGITWKRYGEVKTSTVDRWLTLQFDWDTVKRDARVSVDGRLVSVLPLLRDSYGVCYLRLRSTAAPTDTAGFLD